MPKAIDKPVQLPDKDGYTNRWRLVGGELLSNVHPEGTCMDQHCTIHNPSDHHMRTWPMHFNHGSRQMERTCPHGQQHPDPDELNTNHIKAPNKVHCLNCDTVIQSMFRHDFVSCKCGYESQNGVTTDGGYDYFHFGWGNNAKYEIIEDKGICDGCCHGA